MAKKRPLASDYSRAVLLDIAACGAIEIRLRGQRISDGLIPLFTVDTLEQAEDLRSRFCRRERDGSGIYRVNDRPADLDDVDRIRDQFRTFFDTYGASSAKRKGQVA